ncbi:MAG TPA: hypothetical protein DC057_20355 [Spirochaetia bacterium]|nr:hypothetical protein [Spirochaetia bacterium]
MKNALILIFIISCCKSLNTNIKKNIDNEENLTKIEFDNGNTIEIDMLEKNFKINTEISFNLIETLYDDSEHIPYQRKNILLSKEEIVDQMKEVNMTRKTFHENNYKYFPEKIDGVHFLLKGTAKTVSRENNSSITVIMYKYNMRLVKTGNYFLKINIDTGKCIKYNFNVKNEN